MNKHEFKLGERTVHVGPDLLLAIKVMLTYSPENLKIHTIKLTRELLALGLKEAKDLVDYIDEYAILDGRRIDFRMPNLVTYNGFKETYTTPKAWPDASNGTADLGQMLRDKLDQQVCKNW